MSPIFESNGAFGHVRPKSTTMQCQPGSFAHSLLARSLGGKLPTLCEKHNQPGWEHQASETGCRHPGYKPSTSSSNMAKKLSWKGIFQPRAACSSEFRGYNPVSPASVQAHPRWGVSLWGWHDKVPQTMCLRRLECISCSPGGRGPSQDAGRGCLSPRLPDHLPCLLVGASLHTATSGVSPVWPRLLFLSGH